MTNIVFLVGPVGGYVGPAGGEIGPTESSLGGVRLRIDWLGTDNFDSPFSDCTGDLIGLVTTDRGRSPPNPLVERASPGTFTTILDNRSGKYSSLNAASPLFGLINGRRLIQFSTIYGPLWTGYLLPSGIVASRQGNMAIATITAQGPLSRIAGTRINPAANSGSLTGTIVSAILTAAGWTGPVRIDPGQTITGPWFVQNKDTLSALREMEDTELGWLNEGADGAIVYEDHAHRNTGSALTPQQAYVDDPLYGGSPYPFVYLNPITQIDTSQDVVNDIVVSVTPYSAANSLAVLWTYASTLPTLTIPHGGGSVTLTALANTTGLYVSSWTTPVATTDWTCTGASASDLSISNVVKSAKQMTFTLTNNNVSTDATMTLLQARGVSVPGAAAVSLELSDATSASLYGVMTFRLSPAWLPNVATAQSYETEVILKGKDLREGYSITFHVADPIENRVLFADLVKRDLSDRITLIGSKPMTALGLNQDFFIERKMVSYDPQTVSWVITFECSAVQSEDEATNWILGTSALGVNTFLGF